MLDDARGEPLELVAHVLAGRILALERHPHRALDRHAHALRSDRQPSSSVSFSSDGSTSRGLTTAAAPSSSGSKTNRRREHAELRRREADALRVVHQELHPLDELDELLVELGHLVRLHAQRDVRVLADLGERAAAERLGLRLLLRSASALVVLVIVLARRGRARGRARARARGRARRAHARATAEVYAGKRSRIQAASSGSRRYGSAADLDEVARARIHRRAAPRSGTSGCAARSARSPRRSPSARRCGATRRGRARLARSLREPLEMPLGLVLDLPQPLHVGQRAAERGDVVVGLGLEVAQPPAERLADERVQLAVALEPRALALRVGRDVADAPLAEDLFGVRAALIAIPVCRSSERLRVDVDDGRQPGAAHRRRGRGEQRARPARRDRARAVGLRDELGAVAAAEAQQRRRAEQLGAAACRPSAPRARAAPAPGSGPETTIRTRWRNGG